MILVLKIISGLSVILGIFFVLLAERKIKERDKKLLEDRALMKFGKKLPADIYFSRIEEDRKIALIYALSLFLFEIPFLFLFFEGLLSFNFLTAFLSLFVAIYIFYKFFEILKFAFYQ
jgi:hypothetical protein